jgi:hypothetical protein
METIVLEQILSNYNKNMRPTDQVNINLNLDLKQIVNIDDTNQLMTTSSLLVVSWIDPRLQWNYTQYPLYAIAFQVNKLWTPDLFVLNTANSNGFLPVTDSNLAYIIHTGQIAMNYGLIGLTTRCKMNINKFPMDQQTCSINIGSWFQDIARIRIINQRLDAESNTGYVENQVWTLIDQTTRIIQNTTRFSSIFLSDEIDFSLTIKRGPLSFMLNNVFPCLILNAISLITFFFPFAIQASLSNIIMILNFIFKIQF